MSAGLLGTERSGHGVKIRDDGLIATIGYVVHEAESLWIGNKNAVVPGFVVGQDFDSGLALVKPSLPLQGPSMALGRADALSEDVGLEHHARRHVWKATGKLIEVRHRTLLRFRQAQAACQTRAARTA